MFSPTLHTQICRFCWHRIRNEENGLCPACRKEYDDKPAEFNPVSLEEFKRLVPCAEWGRVEGNTATAHSATPPLFRMKQEKKREKAEKRAREIQSRRALANVRVVQKNLVYVIGLTSRLANEEVLRRPEYFGQYGKIVKIVINRCGWAGVVTPISHTALNHSTLV